MTDTNFALVLMDGCGADSDIKRVVRVYLSERRANEDRDLLEVADSANTYRVISVEYIDN